jgi:hypothetical protein
LSISICFLAKHWMILWHTLFPCSNWLLKLLILFWLFSYSFTGSYLVLFKVIHYSCQTNVLCTTFHTFLQCHPHIQQQFCLCSFINLIKIQNWVLHSYKNWKLMKDQLKGSSAHGVTWKLTLWG